MSAVTLLSSPNSVYRSDGNYDNGGDLGKQKLPSALLWKRLDPTKTTCSFVVFNILCSNVAAINDEVKHHHIKQQQEQKEQEQQQEQQQQQKRYNSPSRKGYHFRVAIKEFQAQLIATIAQETWCNYRNQLNLNSLTDKGAQQMVESSKDSSRTSTKKVVLLIAVMMMIMVMGLMTMMMMMMMMVMVMTVVMMRSKRAKGLCKEGDSLLVRKKLGLQKPSVCPSQWQRRFLTSSVYSWIAPLSFQRHFLVINYGISALSFLILNEAVKNGFGSSVRSCLERSKLPYSFSISLSISSTMNELTS
jgi:hypothetical protein